MDFTKSLFDNGPLKNPVPKDVKCIVVADFFVNDIVGGAELTTDAIFSKSPVKFYKFHSKNLTTNLIRENKDKYWILANFTQMTNDAIVGMIDIPGLKYSILEYDFKICVYRSFFKHFLETGEPCNCHASNHGAVIKQLFQKAQKIFWMSEKQKNIYMDLCPELNVENKNIVQTSTFDEKTLNKLKELREQYKDSEDRKNKVWAIQVSDSWIKGSKDTLAWAQRHGFRVKPLGGLPYDQLLIELAKCHGLIFHPQDYDTSPRLVTEARLLGLELELNNFVMQKDEGWFKSSVEECENFLKGRAEFFWTNFSEF